MSRVVLISRLAVGQWGAWAAAGLLAAALSGCGGGEPNPASPARAGSAGVSSTAPVAAPTQASEPAAQTTRRALATQPLGRSSARGSRTLFDAAGALDNMDFNGDGKADLLWTNATTGETVLWLMNGKNLTATNRLLRDPDFKVIGAGDFNGDGKTDLVWFNAVTRKTVLWFMNGTALIGGGEAGNDPNYAAIGAPDLNGDGKSDLLWYNATTGQTVAWLMDGLNRIGDRLILHDANFQVVALPDLNGDGKTDLVWHSKASGQTIAWLMNGTAPSANAVLLTHPTFKVQAAPDLNGDGKSDLVWYNPVTGETVGWLMNGMALVSGSRLLADANFVVVAVADLNGDGNADLIWHHASAGQTVAWLMNGMVLLGGNPLLTDRRFEVASAPDLNGDGRSDLVWHSASTGQSIAWVMNGTALQDVGNVLTDRAFRLVQPQRAAQVYATAFDACFIGTPKLYGQRYCVAYAAARAAAATAADANYLGAESAASNVGNVGTGQPVTGAGTPLPAKNLWGASYLTAFNTCFVGTPALYSSTYCVAYAAASTSGASPAAANRIGATAAGSNVGDIGIGQPVDPVGTPLTQDTTPGASVQAPAITQQPANQAVNAGDNANFAAQASGSALNLQWQLSTDNGATWAGVPDATSATLVVRNVASSANGWLYRVAASNSAGAVTSNAARLTVSQPVALPAIAGQPQGATRIVGQNFVTTVSATGSQLSYAWEYSLDGNAPWTPIPGASNATLTLGAVSIEEDNRRYRARVSNLAGSVFSGSAALSVKWGEVVPSADTSQLEVSTGGSDGGDGGTSGGGDGGGADGGGGLGKVLNGRITITRTTNGALIGSTLTHPVTGLVKIKAGPGAAPFLITLQGDSGATYFDEGKNTMLPFGAQYQFRALIDRFDENVAVTALTEAAYRYAINNFVGNPAQIRSGQQPLLRSASVATLTASQIRQANEVIRTEINRFLPQQIQVPSVKSLPTPLDNLSPRDALRTSRYGLAAVLTGGLTRQAHNYVPNSVAPGLELVEQLARDLTDGKIDGFALDGSPASSSSSSSIYFDVSRKAVELAAAAASISNQFGAGTTLLRSPPISDFSAFSTYLNGNVNSGCKQTGDDLLLLRDGTLRVTRAVPLSGQQCFNSLAHTPVATQTFSEGNVRFVRGNFSQAYIVKTDGSVRAWGDATCGVLGNGASTGRVNFPITVSGLSNITSLASGNTAVVARDTAGNVYSWGSNSDGMLGLGNGITYDLQSCDPYPGSFDAAYTDVANTRARRIPSLSNIVSVAAEQRSAYALDTSGRVFMWGIVATTSSPFGTTIVTPTLVPGFSSIASITASTQVLFGLKADGTVWGYGSNSFGTFGDGSKTPKTIATRVPGLVEIVQIAGDANGGGAMAALQRDGTVLLWGASTPGWETPRTPIITTCTTDSYSGPVASGCNLRTGALPKMRSISSSRIGITMIGLDGTVYLFAATNVIFIIQPTGFAPPPAQGLASEAPAAQGSAIMQGRVR